MTIKKGVIVISLVLSNVFYSFTQTRLSSYPYISGDTFRDFVIENKGFLIDETREDDTSLVKPGDFIFVKSDKIGTFFSTYRPKIKNPYILITHNSDLDATLGYEKHLNDEKLIAWFAQNTHIANHSKVIAIPIGIANRYWEHGNIEEFNKVSKSDSSSRTNLVYINFSVGTHPKRQTVFDILQKKNFISLSPVKNLHNYLKDLRNSKFVACPRGNGLDTHRTWETLLMGSIPIVESSSLNSLYTELPVLVINNWDDLTKNFLENKYMEFSLNKLNTGKMYASYWLDLIKRVRNDYLRTNS